MYELIIAGGIIVDGSGGEPYPADLAVRSGRVACISPHIDTNRAVRVIDVSGCVVSPGFVDIHSHTDFTILENPRAESKVRQGITTEIVGNCGFTAAPVVAERFDELMQYLVNTVALTDEQQKEWKWPSQSNFMEEVEGRGSSVNLVPLVGHGTLRVAVMGFADREPNLCEMQQMQRLLELELRQGLWGLSTGLQYEPGSFATTGELIALSRIVARYGGIYATHLKSEGRHLLPCLQEAVHIAEETGVSLQVSHLKAAEPANWGKVKDALQLLDQAAADGVKAGFDVYPYTAFGSGLLDLVPPYVRAKGAKAMAAMLQDLSCCERILKEMAGPSTDAWENPMAGTSWDRVRIAAVKSERNRFCEGKDLLEIASLTGCSPPEAVLNLLQEEQGAVKMIFFGMCDDDLHTVMTHPGAIYAGDGRAVAPYGELGRGKIHPRYYGTFPRILGRYVREMKLVSLPEAVMKMTWLPAAKVGLQSRGLLKEGFYADITVFQPDKIIDIATFAEPHRFPEGIEYVFVGGVEVVNPAGHTGALPGKVLRKGVNSQGGALFEQSRV